MLRKLIVGAAVALTFGATALVPTEADARHGWRGGWHGGWRGGRVVVVRPVARAFVIAPVIVPVRRLSCWRWVPTRWGYAKVWVC
jgi:hypothetical protein